MGLDDAVRGATTGETGTAFVDERGEVVADFPAGRSDTGRATAEVEILRGELARLLYEGTRDGAAGRRSPSALGGLFSPPADEIDLPRYQTHGTGPLMIPDTGR
jgi:hypothetical protein